MQEEQHARTHTDTDTGTHTSLWSRPLTIRDYRVENVRPRRNVFIQGDGDVGVESVDP